LRKRIFLKLLFLIVVVVGVSTAALDLLVRRSWEASLLSQLHQGLQDKVQMFAARADREAGTIPFQQLVSEIGKAARARATIIDRSGKVLADSEAQAEAMENHATRPEFIAAFSGKIGSDTRTSHTLGIQFSYVAAPTSFGAVRLAYPLSSIRPTFAKWKKSYWKRLELLFWLGFSSPLSAQRVFREDCGGWLSSLRKSRMGNCRRGCRSQAVMRSQFWL